MQNILTWSIYFKVEEEFRENSGKFWPCVLRRHLHLISTFWPSVAFDFSIESFKLIITEEIAELLTVTQTFDWQLHSPGCHTLRYDISSSDKDWKSMARVSLRQPAVWLMLLQGKRWCWPLTHTHTHTHTHSLSLYKVCRFDPVEHFQSFNAITLFDSGQENMTLITETNMQSGWNAIKMSTEHSVDKKTLSHLI